MWISVEQVSSLDEVSGTGHLLYLKAVHAKMHTTVVHVVGHDLALCCAVGNQKHSSSPLLPPIGPVSSAHRRLHMGLPSMEMDVLWSWGVYSMIFSRNNDVERNEEKTKHLRQTLTYFYSKEPPQLIV